LGKIGPAAKAGVPALLQQPLMDQSSHDLQLAIAEALGGIGPAARNGVPLLIRFLRENGEVACAAAEALGKIGPGAKDAVPALMRVRGTERGKLRRTAAEALSRIALGT
jgi:HEAT repeat protein